MSSICQRSRWVVVAFFVAAILGARGAVAQNVESFVNVIEGLEPVRMEYDEITLGARLDTVGDIDRYAFFGEAGDSVEIRIQNLDSQELRVVVRDPDGKALINRSCADHGCNIWTSVVLEARGEHEIQVSETHRNETGRYRLHFSRFLPNFERPERQQVYLGSAGLRDTLWPGPDLDYFVFHAVAGSRVSIQVRTHSNMEIHARLYDPAGERLGQWQCGSHNCDLNFSTEVLGLTGTYTLAVSEPQINETGDYSIEINCISGDCPPIVPAIYQLREAGPNCVSVHLINNISLRGGELSIGYPSSLVSIEPAGITPGPGMPTSFEVESVTDLALTSCDPLPDLDPEHPIDRGLTINWLDREGGDDYVSIGRHDLLTLCFDPADGTDNESCPQLRFLDCLGPPEGPVSQIVTDAAGGSHDAETVDARLCLTIDTFFRRGDANGDAAFDVSDAISILTCQFLGRGCSRCLIASDANDDGVVDPTDALYLLTWRFLEGPPPPPPFPVCGADPTPDEGFDLCIEPACI